MQYTEICTYDRRTCYVLECVLTLGQRDGQFHAPTLEILRYLQSRLRGEDPMPIRYTLRALTMRDLVQFSLRLEREPIKQNSVALHNIEWEALSHLHELNRGNCFTRNRRKAPVRVQRIPVEPATPEREECHPPRWSTSEDWNDRWNSLKTDDPPKVSHFRTSWWFIFWKMTSA